MISYLFGIDYKINSKKVIFLTQILFLRCYNVCISIKKCLSCGDEIQICGQIQRSN